MHNADFNDLPFHIDDDRTSGAKRVTLRIPKDLSFFQGHFPGFPVLPGVIIIELSLFFANKLNAIGGTLLKSVSKTKFIHPVFPEEEVTIKLEHKAEGHYKASWEKPSGQALATIEFSLARVQ
jgi:3-hydroxymyristoyl/3-hydroxydecanoyl-(acyl carrier protein) dehydratase